MEGEVEDERQERRGLLEGRESGGRTAGSREKEKRRMNEHNHELENSREDSVYTNTTRRKESDKGGLIIQPDIRNNQHRRERSQGRTPEKNTGRKLMFLPEPEGGGQLTTGSGHPGIRQQGIITTRSGNKG